MGEIERLKELIGELSNNELLEILKCELSEELPSITNGIIEDSVKFIYMPDNSGIEGYEIKDKECIEGQKKALLDLAYYLCRNKVVELFKSEMLS
jgi:hypothetical protein